MVATISQPLTSVFDTLPILDLAAPDITIEANRRLANLRAQGPACQVQPVGAVGLLLWADCDRVLRDAQSFSAEEVRQLTKTLSSVKLAWDEGRYADCQRLLDGYWGQLLLSDPVAPPAVSPPRTRLSDRVKTMFRR